MRPQPGAAAADLGNCGPMRDSNQRQMADRQRQHAKLHGDSLYPTKMFLKNNLRARSVPVPVLCDSYAR